MIASNEEWVVPAAIDARRFLMLDVGEEHKSDHAYFAAIWQELDAGGYEAMLYDLLHMDITRFNVRDVPKTDALQDQKQQSLPIRLAWWQDVLFRGYVYDSRHGLEEYFTCWRDRESTSLLYAAYNAYARAHGERHPLNAVSFGRFMHQLGARARNLRSRPVVGEHVIHDGGSKRAYPVNADTH